MIEIVLAMCVQYEKTWVKPESGTYDRKYALCSELKLDKRRNLEYNKKVHELEKLFGMDKWK